MKQYKELYFLSLIWEHNSYNDKQLFINTHQGVLVWGYVPNSLYQ